MSDSLFIDERNKGYNSATLRRLQVSKLIKLMTKSSSSNAMNATAVIKIYFWVLFCTSRGLPAMTTQASSYKGFQYFIVTLFDKYIVQAPKKK